MSLFIDRKAKGYPRKTQNGTNEKKLLRGNYFAEKLFNFFLINDKFLKLSTEIKKKKKIDVWQNKHKDLFVYIFLYIRCIVYTRIFSKFSLQIYDGNNVKNVNNWSHKVRKSKFSFVLSLKKSCSHNPLISATKNVCF